MNIKNRIKRIESAANNCSHFCQCAANSIATSKAAFTVPTKCADCRGIIKSAVLVVGDLSEIANFNFPVKIYAGFDANLV